MKTFTFAGLNKLGEFDEKYGQRYWGVTNEQLEPVMFNSMNQDISETDTIEAGEVFANKKSTKGVMYTPLKKVKVVGSQSRGETSPPATNEAKPQPADQTQLPDAAPSQLDRIEFKLDQLLGNRDITEIPDET